MPPLQKKANGKTGSEMQRDRDDLAAKMREKQAAGKYFEVGLWRKQTGRGTVLPKTDPKLTCLFSLLADARKAADASKK